MPMIAWRPRAASVSRPPLLCHLVTATLLLVAVWTTVGAGMTDDELSALREDTRHLFYHGYENYIAHAFPEDELRPISCRPQTRNRDDPGDIGTNDVLGNYSVTLIDSLSTLAIMASDPDVTKGHEALLEFQTGIKSIVDLYGDGTEEGRCGTRACAFDLDSKVQVFETNIRGVGGLLSAHLFAMGDLPIDGYVPEKTPGDDGTVSIDWEGWAYDGQLLRLAHDLASRLLPAFSTATGLPYPRVNLRTGIPFYQDTERGVCRLDGSSSDPREITETCTAGAGSLVLEFTTLSRLTGDSRFETLAKRAFWAVWQRRSSIGLLAGGIDAESGLWITPALAGIGAGIDSFFEYAFKSHILLSGLPPSPTPEYDDSEEFLQAWQEAHAAVKRHIYRSASSEKHAFYGQADLISGAPRYSWIDNLSAYYPGLLVLAGELDEAIESHLLYAALWTRYSALPERWHVFNSWIDPNFRHWAGRPEFIESTYYLYQATKDPWYLHVGEMALRDIRRRCWTECGWADLGDVVSGELRDRMESFFLGETAKYLYLLFTPDHPLNRLDAPLVFSTEGHPLVVPISFRTGNAAPLTQPSRRNAAPICPLPPPPLPLTISNTASLPTLFHAAALAQLHLVPINPARSSSLLPPSSSSPGISLQDVRSPSNYTFYPWTLPTSLIPTNGVSEPIFPALLSTLTFPNLHSTDENGGGIGSERSLLPLGSVQKVLEGVVVNSLSNLRLNMVQEPILSSEGIGVVVGAEYRIHGIANWALGKDEKVLISAKALGSVSPADPHFTRIKDLEMVDLVVDVGIGEQKSEEGADSDDVMDVDEVLEMGMNVPTEVVDGLWTDIEALFTALLSSAKRATRTPTPTLLNPPASNNKPTEKVFRHIIPAILPAGPGAVPISDFLEVSTTPSIPLPITPSSIFFLEDELCMQRLPTHIARGHSILVLPRGGCSFSEKLAHIPPVPADAGLKLVIILDNTGEYGGKLIRPLLDEVQRSPAGVDRREGLGLCLVDGTVPARGGSVGDVLREVAGGVGRFDDGGMGEFVIEGRKEGGEAVTLVGGIGVKRRFRFESLGVVIGNLIML